MFAVVEFTTKGAAANELAIVPLIWLHKNDKACFWPRTINKSKSTTFMEFVRKQTPYKKSWPSYKIHKVHYKTGSYDDAEKKIGELLESGSDGASTSTTSLFVQKVIDNDNDNHNISEDTSSKESSEEEEEIPSKIQKILNKDETERQNLSLATASTLTYVPSIRSTPTKSSSVTSSAFQEEILGTLNKISANVENHSVILQELLRVNRNLQEDKLISPPNLPTFPITNLESFIAFDSSLENDTTLHDYLVKRLAAVGGSGLEAVTRRIMRFLINNNVAINYNWKGRDKKMSFEITNTMKLVYEAAKRHFPQAEKNDLVIANTVKDWLKFAKARMIKKTSVI